MSELLVRCPACRAGIKVRAIPPGKKAFACPKCRAAVPYPRPRPGPEEEEPLVVTPADDEDEDAGEEEESPPARRRKARRDDDEDEGRPRRRRKKNKPVVRPWLWGVVPPAGLVVAALTVAFFYAVTGGTGFPDPQEGPWIVKPIVLCFMTAVGAAMVLVGTNGIVNERITMARYFLTVKVWEQEHRGAMAIAIGAGQCLVGSIIIGVGLYGLVF